MQIGIPKENYGKKVRKNKPQNIQKPSQEITNKKEQLVLKVSMYCALLLAILGIGFGIIIKSATLMFDGIVSLVSVVLGLLSVITSRYIYRQDDDVFQYGYVRFEPMVNLFKSLILVSVCIYAFIGGIRDIINGGYTLEIGGAVVYTICAFLLCFIIYGYITFYSKRLDSELIKVDRVEWLIDCVMYCGGILAFGFIFLFDSNQEKWFSRYIDSGLLVVLSLFLLITPIKIVVVSLKDLMMVAPVDLDNRITEVMEALSSEYGFNDYDTHVAKSGRFFMIEVNILSINSEAQISIGQIDHIREKIEKNLEIPSYKIWLSVSLTANPKWL